MNIVTDERVARFVGERVGSIIVPPFVAIGVEKAGEVVGGVVFNCFTGSDVEMTVAGEPKAFTRGFYRAVYRYVFDDLKANRISITTENHHVVTLAERLGAKVEGIKRNCFGEGRDGFILGILKKEWALT